MKQTLTLEFKDTSDILINQFIKRITNDIQDKVILINDKELIIDVSNINIIKLQGILNIYSQNGFIKKITLQAEK
jgi:hypothetical protein